MQEAVRQRIKYLVEHGELYPASEQRASDRHMHAALAVLVVLNLVETSVLLARFL